MEYLSKAALDKKVWQSYIVKITVVGTISLAGLVLAKRKFSDMVKNPVVYVVSLLRLVVIPLALWGILYLCGVRGNALSVPVLVLAMPVAVNGVMLAEGGGGDSVTVAQTVFVSTLFSAVTIPVLAYFIV